VLGVIGPVVGAVMHEVSALPVVANSARLVTWKPRRTTYEANRATVTAAGARQSLIR
jgi:hypothetical protein